MKKAAGLALLITGGVLTCAPWVGGAAAAEGSPCTTSTFQWSGDQLLLQWSAPSNVSFPTGVVVPAAAAGETLTVVSATYEAYDRYQTTATRSRAEADQPAESFGVTVGSVVVGGLFPDLPDNVAEGAVDDYYSGLVAGTFPGSSNVAITGGEIVLRHSSWFGTYDTPNSVRAAKVRIVVERCAAPAPTTSTTVAPTTSTTVAPTTSTTVAPTTSTTVAPTTSTTVAPTTSTTVAPTTSTTVAPTTSTAVVDAGGPDPTTTTTAPAVMVPTTTTTTTTVVSSSGPPPSDLPTTTIVAAAGPTPTGSLPVTGSRTNLPLLLGGLSMLTGLALLSGARRRA